MKFNSRKEIGKAGLILALAFGLIGVANTPAFAKERGFGPHSGFRGNGGLGRGGYHFGDRFEDNHPRRSEVLGRDNRLNWNINKDRGQLGGHYNQLEQEQRSIRQQEQADARANGGYITRQQQMQLNGEENRLHNQLSSDFRGGEGFGPHSGFGGQGGLGRGGYHFGDKFEDNHPRRSEVLARDNNLNYQINKDRGHLDGQYGNLEQQQRSIRQQEQSDARANGGYITQQQQQQLNQEENQLHQQINQDMQQ